MAKISARGATEVARITATLPTVGGVVTVGATLVITSDGRILRKFEGSGYNLMARVKNPKFITEEFLRSFATRRGYKVN